MTDLSVALQAVHTRICTAACSVGRAPDSIQLLAVSKTRPAADIRAAYAAGQCAFGENYAQELLDKVLQLADLPLEWHFIGPVQSNKTRGLAEHVHWVHSIDRLKTAERLSSQRPAHMPPLQVCIQVNVSGETAKSGVLPDAVGVLARQIAALPRLCLRGLMCIPEATSDTERLRAQFQCLRGLIEGLREQGLVLDTLSMGMSSDLAVAVTEGATLVRVGTAIFGERAAPV